MEHDHTTDHQPSPKNLVICCDGTGNEISENISNVLKLYRCLRKTDKTSPREPAATPSQRGPRFNARYWHGAGVGLPPSPRPPTASTGD